MMPDRSRFSRVGAGIAVAMETEREEKEPTSTEPGAPGAEGGEASPATDEKPAKPADDDSAVGDTDQHSNA
jgi:hypothetical protein